MASYPPFGIPSGTNIPTDSPVLSNPGTLLEGQTEPGFDRTGPLISPEELVEDFLFGLPLTSALTNQTMSMDSIKRQISRAVSDLETSLRIPISPVRVSERFDYNRADDAQGTGTKKLSKFPVIQVESLSAAFPGSNASTPDGYTPLPTSWVSILGDTGLVRIVPVASPAVGGQGDVSYPVGFMYPTFWMNVRTWPNLWAISYLAGFPHDQIPRIINEAIGTTAALKILSMLGPLLFPVNGTSTAMSGMSQSTSTMGPQFLALRVQELTAERERILANLKNHYCQDIFFAAF